VLDSLFTVTQINSSTSQQHIQEFLAEQQSVSLFTDYYASRKGDNSK
jgi:hypothetical protein